MSGKYENLHKVNELEKEALQYDIDGWLQYDLFTFDWWLLVIFFILPWIVWIKLVDRNRMVEIFLFGMFIIKITTITDILGTELDFWQYPTSLLPMFPRAFPFDISMVPVAFMLIYQFFTTWKTYTYALLTMATIYAFVGEPFCVWKRLVIYPNWNYFYSFIFYLVVGTAIRAFIIKLKSLRN
ncbi:CBO0543 family protein [Ornithinibacillus xuwenensis]|uniref:CBO0543 family protein n=1 Tax=Ornithinibacillus xuwenensis TaxID=3144668 RepID=A0ABU9XDJ6_9BACI